MPREKPNTIDAPAELAKRITEALLRERVVPRFVDSYVVENGRHLYVTSGVGTSTHPVRFARPPEVVVLTLRATA